MRRRVSGSYANESIGASKSATALCSAGMIAGSLAYEEQKKRRGSGSAIEKRSETTLKSSNPAVRASTASRAPSSACLVCQPLAANNEVAVYFSVSLLKALFQNRPILEAPGIYSALAFFVSALQSTLLPHTCFSVDTDSQELLSI